MHPPILFFRLDESEKVPPKRSHWLERLRTARVILPRELCIYQRIPCKGVPRLRMRAFAQIQTQSLSPFASTGSFALHQAEWLHLWLWNKDLEEQMARHFAPGQRFSIWPSSLLGSPRDSEVSLLQTSQVPGIELQLWQQRMLADSLWLPSFPSQDEWAALYAQTPELQSNGWPEQLPTQPPSSPANTAVWGRNLTPRPESKLQVRWPSLINLGLSLVTVAMLGWAGWIYGQKNSAQYIIDTGLQTQAAEAVAMEPLLQARQRAQHNLDWLHQASKLSPQPTTNSLLLELADTWPRQGMALRELEILPPTIQATLTPSNSTGSSIKLTAMLELIENSPNFHDARFVDVAGNGAFKFTWRIKGVASTPGQNAE